MQARAARLRSQGQLFFRLRAPAAKPSIYVSTRGKTGMWGMLVRFSQLCVRSGCTRAELGTLPLDSGSALVACAGGDGFAGSARRRSAAPTTPSARAREKRRLDRPGARAPSAEHRGPHNKKPEARESPYTHNEKHESEEVLGRRTFLRDASTFLRRRLEDPIRPSQLPVQF